MGTITLRVNTLIAKPPKGYLVPRGYKEQVFKTYYRKFKPWPFGDRNYFWGKHSNKEATTVALYGLPLVVNTFSTQSHSVNIYVDITEEEVRVLLEKAKTEKHRWRRNYVGERSKWP